MAIKTTISCKHYKNSPTTHKIKRQLDLFALYEMPSGIKPFYTTSWMQKSKRGMQPIRTGSMMMSRRIIDSEGKWGQFKGMPFFFQGELLERLIKTRLIESGSLAQPCRLTNFTFFKKCVWERERDSKMIWNQEKKKINRLSLDLTSLGEKKPHISCSSPLFRSGVRLLFKFSSLI